MKKLMTLLGALALLSTGAYAQEAGAAAPEAAGTLAVWEMIVFCVVVIGVIGLGIWKSSDPTETEKEKKEKGAADYFLAGRGLSWWLVGFSLLAANISTEQFVGMSGQAADWLGLAIAGYEWLAAIVLVIVAFTFLPMLLKRGVFTIPQFLEERFNGVSRVTMALVNLIILVGVPTAAVIYAGANVISVYFNMDVTVGCIIIAVCATVYVYVGGLKACAWTDLIWGAGLLLGGGVVAYFAVTALGSIDMASPTGQAVIATASDSSAAMAAGADAMQSTGSALCDGLHRLWTLNDGDASSAVNGIGGKLHMMRQANDPVMPWTVYLLGLWIPNFFYWGLNQYIMQRTLASKSLAEGQMGVVFAAGLKLLIPFVVLIPGILAYNLYSTDMKASATAKATATIASVEASGKTPLYRVTADYLVAEPEKAAGYLRHNAEAAGSDAQKADMAAYLDDYAAILSAPDTASVNALAGKHGYALPEEVTELTKQQRIAASMVAAKAAKVSDAVISDKAKAADASAYAVTEALNGYDYDSAFGTLLRKLLPGTGWAWFVLAALFGAVVSSLASMLNSASTLFTMDIYHKLRKEQSSQKELVNVGKVGVLVCAAIALWLAIFLSDKLDSIFSYIQEFQGFLSPGALAVFLFGFFVPKCPRVFGWLGILLGAIFYALCKWVILPEWAFLDRMAVSFVAVVLVGFILTIINHMNGGEAVILENKGIIEMKTSSRAKFFGAIVVAMTVALYILFW